LKKTINITDISSRNNSIETIKSGLDSSIESRSIYLSKREKIEYAHRLQLNPKPKKKTKPSEEEGWESFQDPSQKSFRDAYNLMIATADHHHHHQHFGPKKRSMSKDYQPQFFETEKMSHRSNCGNVITTSYVDSLRSKGRSLVNTEVYRDRGAEKKRIGARGGWVGDLDQDTSMVHEFREDSGSSEGEEILTSEISEGNSADDLSCISSIVSFERLGN
jgi:hypothetical protein